MNNPKILGRTEDDDRIDERSSTRQFATVKEQFEAGAVGSLTATLFKSESDGDRGGLVLRITLDDLASSFIPHAVALENGVEIHMAGDVEAKSLVTALKKALASV